MKMRVVALVVLAVVVLLALTATAIALPDACPAGTHPLSASTCLSDGEHAAPSSGIMIPDYSTAPDGRLGARLGLVALGVLTAGGLVVLAVRRSRGGDGSHASALVNPASTT
jgi:hypothetical protein